MSKKKRKRYSREFKEEAVRALRERGGETVAEVGTRFGIHETLLHTWRRQLEQSASNDRGETPEEELKRLRRENAQLKKDRDALVKSISVFVRERR
ncbi:MAG: transposase [Myxococcota bacterium]